MNASTSNGGARKPHPSRAASQWHVENGMKKEVVNEEDKDVREEER
jgi:hypothetical protein